MVLGISDRDTEQRECVEPRLGPGTSYQDRLHLSVTAPQRRPTAPLVTPPPRGARSASRPAPWRLRLSARVSHLRDAGSGLWPTHVNGGF